MMQGVYLGSTQLISMVGCVVAPMAEIFLARKGLAATTVRRAIGGAGGVLQACCVSGFVMVPSGGAAALLYGLNSLFKCFTNDGGYYTNCERMPSPIPWAPAEPEPGPEPARA